jgi:hypothetical protein
LISTGTTDGEPKVSVTETNLPSPDDRLRRGVGRDNDRSKAGSETSATARVAAKRL